MVSVRLRPICADVSRTGNHSGIADSFVPAGDVEGDRVPLLIGAVSRHAGLVVPSPNWSVPPVTLLPPL